MEPCTPHTGRVFNGLYEQSKYDAEQNNLSLTRLKYKRKQK